MYSTAPFRPSFSAPNNMQFHGKVASLALLFIILMIGSVLSATVPSKDKKNLEAEKEDPENSTEKSVKTETKGVETPKPAAARPAPQAAKNQAAFKGGRRGNSGRMRQGKSNQRQQINSRAGGRGRGKLGNQAVAATPNYGDYYGNYGAVTVNRRRKNKRGRKRKHGPFETSEEWTSSGGDYGNYNYGG